MAPLIDIIGKRFGRLVVASRGESVRVKRGTKTVWLCRCDCGVEVAVLGNNLRSGKSKSCGCGVVEATTKRCLKHGRARRGSKSPEYKIWVEIRRRCNNQNWKQYVDYGGRGIRVCERWNDFANFLADMGPRPSPHHQIDRYPDNDGNYEPGNCRWATRKQQAGNRRRRRWAIRPQSN